MDQKNRNSELLSRAVSLHQAGNLNEAETLYRAILSSDSNHINALTLLGTIYLQRGQREEGARLIELSLKINPKQPAALNNRGNALLDLKQPAQALASFDEAIALMPGYAEAYNNRGNALNNLKRQAEALASFDKAIALQPDFAEAYYNRGVALQTLNRSDQAVASYDRAIALRPEYAEAHYNRGIALQEQRHPDEALTCFDRAIALKPDYAEAYYNRGNALIDLKRPAEALASFDQAIVLNPGFAEAYHNRGLALHNLKRPAEALTSYDRALALKPDYAEAYNNRGNTLSELKRPAEGLASFDQAIALNPGFADAYHNRGLALHDLKRPAEGLASFDQAIALNPGFAEAYINRGLTLIDLKRPAEALASFDKTIALNPGFAEAYWNKGLLKLLLGEYEEGWELYEWRWKTDKLKTFARSFPKPLWLGKASLANKTILLHAEQGFGDCIQICRFVPMVKALGAQVVLEVEQSLVALFSTLTDSIRVIPAGSPLPEFDFHCPLMSLPLAFKTTVSTIPAKMPYLATDASKQKQWQKKLGTTTRPRIGLVWSGSQIYKNDNRSIPLDMLSPLLELGLEFHCLQKEITPANRDLLAIHHRIKTYENDLNDFSDTAALIGQMDLVISVDTAVAHLAGALGKPVWILLPFVTDYRWFIEQEDSPWYPTARLFRQPKISDWTSVIAKVAAELMP